MGGNTRFVPTPTGPLHIGHAFLCLLNVETARANGGKFIVRMEDRWADEAMVHRSSLFSKDMGDSILRDLEWLGMSPDFVSWQRDTEWLDHLVLERFPDLAIPDHVVKGLFKKQHQRLDINLLHHTPGKVVFDHLFRCDPVIRGEDLCIEHYWYVYLCGLFGFPVPEMIYVPRMMLDQETISKTGTAHVFIKDLRDKGWTPEGVMGLVREKGLIDPAGGPQFRNVQRQIVIMPADLAEPR